MVATPNCHTRPSRLISTQCSSTWPPTTRLNSMLEKATCLPVGRRPWNSPRWVPRKAVMVKEADLDRIGVPEDYEVLNATALGRRLGCKRDTVFAYLPQSLALSS
jgi:hypothetical protein